jgi:hypothetical protein
MAAARGTDDSQGKWAGKGETAPFCPIETANTKEMEWTHEPHEAAWARRLATRLQETFNGNQGTVEAGNEKPAGSAYGKEDDQQPT